MAKEYHEYNPGGGINKVWAFHQILQKQTERLQQQYQYNNESYYSDDDFSDSFKDFEEFIDIDDGDRYENAFNFLKRHSAKSDEEIALEVLNILG